MLSTDNVFTDKNVAVNRLSHAVWCGVVGRGLVVAMVNGCIVETGDREMHGNGTDQKNC